MLMRRDFDMNSVHIYTDSLKDAMKKTMLNQEIIFTKQVHELHRLYRMQKKLMQNLSWEEFDRYDSRNPSTESSLFTHINSAGYQPLAKEVRISSIPKVDLTHFTSQLLLEGCEHIFSKPQQRPVGLQLSAHQYNGHADPELRLSLSVGEDNRRMGGAKRSRTEVKTHSCIQNVIYLEESDERLSNEDSGHAPSSGCAAPTLTFGGKNESQNSVLTDPSIASSVKKDLFHETVGSNSLLDDPERNFLNQDLNKGHGDILFNNLSAKKQEISLFATGHVDLNKVRCDDSSCYSNDPMMAHCSTASSSHAVRELVRRVENGSFRSTSSKIDYNNGSNEISEILHPDDAGKFSIIDSNCNYERTEIRAGNSKFNGLSSSVIEIDLETVSGPKIGLYEDLGCQRNDRSDGSTLEIPKSRIHTYEERKPEDVVFSCSNDYSQNKVPDGHCDISSASCEPLHIVDNESSSADIAQSEVEPGNPSAVDQFSGPQKDFQVLKTLSGGNQIYTDSSELKLKHEDLKKEESDEVDILIQKAAESLIHISLESPARYKDCSTGDGGSNEMENEEIQRPKCSDFYELITLKLTESCADDSSVSSKPPDFNFTDKNDYGFKLRRGRRLKDFQKDILPSLASLSRHEIREDINILEGVLRSREYRKMRAEMGDGQSWCTPMRSKRSRRRFL